jgi:predicted DNA-binding transcriptional regulator YafY
MAAPYEPMRPGSVRISDYVHDMADVTARMLALLSALQTGRAFTGDELASRLDVSPRTLRRDIDRLRGYGYPVDTRPGPGGFYQLASGHTMPPLVFDDGEAVAVLVGLATLAASGSDVDGTLDDAAASAYGKVDQVLPRRLRARAGSIRSSIETARQNAPGVAPSTLSALAGAVTEHRLVSFAYRDAAGASTDRRVEPYRQVHVHLRWYLLGWDLDRADWRIYRTDRIDDLRVSGASFVPRPLPSDSALDYIRVAFRAKRRRVTIEADAPVAAVIDALNHQDAEIVSLSENRTRITVWLESWQWLILNLAFLDAPFTIVEPRAFRDACAAFADRLTTAARMGKGRP